MGFATAQFERQFFSTQTVLDAYVIFTMSVWVLFLIVGSLAASAQVYLYAFWPLYGWLSARGLWRAGSVASPQTVRAASS